MSELFNDPPISPTPTLPEEPSDAETTLIAQDVPPAAPEYNLADKVIEKMQMDNEDKEFLQYVQWVIDECCKQDLEIISLKGQIIKLESKISDMDEEIQQKDEVISNLKEIIGIQESNEAQNEGDSDSAAQDEPVPCSSSSILNPGQSKPAVMTPAQKKCFDKAKSGVGEDGVSLNPEPTRHDNMSPAPPGMKWELIRLYKGGYNAQTCKEYEKLTPDQQSVVGKTQVDKFYETLESFNEKNKVLLDMFDVEEDYVCAICAFLGVKVGKEDGFKSFGSKYSLERHYGRVHVKESKCDACKEKFANNIERWNHIQRLQNDPKHVKLYKAIMRKEKEKQTKERKGKKTTPPKAQQKKRGGKSQPPPPKKGRRDSSESD